MATSAAPTSISPLLVSLTERWRDGLLIATKPNSPLALVAAHLALSEHAIDALSVPVRTLSAELSFTIHADGDRFVLATANQGRLTVRECFARTVPDALMGPLGPVELDAAPDAALPSDPQQALNALCAPYERYLHRNGLPPSSCDELLHTDAPTRDQRDWLSLFLGTWDSYEQLLRDCRSA